MRVKPQTYSDNLFHSTNHINTFPKVIKALPNGMPHEICAKTYPNFIISLFFTIFAS